MSINKLSKNLIELRTKANLTQEDLAKKIGVTKQTISNYEKGSREPDIFTAIKFAVLFNCSLDDLILGGTNIDRKELSNLDDIENILNNLDSAKMMDDLFNKKVQLQTMYNAIPKKIKLIDSLIDVIKEDFE